jgi:hypothetical protein
MELANTILMILKLLAAVMSMALALVRTQQYIAG